MPAPDAEHRRRSIRSFVKRTGRLTKGQKYALEHLWSVYGLDFQPEEVNLAALFANADCIKLEIGFGNGETLVEMASQDPACSYLGIEVHKPGVGHCLQQAQRLELDNLKLIAHDAIEVLEQMIPPASLDRVLLFFPDPWHKKRHHKRRIVNPHFRDLLVRVLKPAGVVHLATDWQDYAEHMAVEFLSDPRFRNLGDQRGYSLKPDYRPQTRFERRGLRLGHGVWDLLFSRAGE